MRAVRILCALAFIGAGACQDEPTVPSLPSVPTASDRSTQTLTPNFLHPAAGAPSIANPTVSFYAKQGETRQAVMLYHADPGATDSTVFVRFKVGAKSLLTRPDGSRIAAGDSLLITFSLVDPVRLIVDFQPAGLQFDPKDPAELRMSFAETDPDVNGDGVVNQQDTVLTRRFKIWREETTADPWFSLPSDVFLLLHEVEAPVNGFTRYAIAY